MIKYAALGIIAFIFAYASQEVATRLGYESYKEILGALINISSIVFAVIGAWIAIIYPRAISKVFKDGTNLNGLKTSGDGEKDAGHLADLIEIEVVSAFVLMSVLIIQFACPVARSIASPEILLSLRKVGFGAVLFLTLLQLYAVGKVIHANYKFLNEARIGNIDAEADRLNR